MAGAEKGLEEVLLEIGRQIFYETPSEVGELLSLLDQAETLLSRVEQSPSESMFAALNPAMKGLTCVELLDHSDVDVKVAVASCISEITRITAPEAPYDDDFMKDIFQLIVESFENLDDMQSRSYSKRVSILETVAKVRSCVVMLDLECDDLILEMFHYFLKTIRSLEIPITWKNDINIVQYRSLQRETSTREQECGQLDGRSYAENSKVSESLILMKFYSLSSGVVNHMISSSDGKETFHLKLLIKKEK